VNKLERSSSIPYTERMKNKITDRLRAQEINLMNGDDKSMHIFYTLDEIENLVKSLHKKMDENDPTLGQKIVTLENIIETLERMHSRCEFSAKFLQTPIVTA
jgi:hypothetical protein